MGFLTSVSVVRLIAPRGRPLVFENAVLGFERVPEKPLRIDAFSRIVGTGVDAARDGELGAKVAGVRLVSCRFLFLDLDRRRDVRVRGFDLGLHFLGHFQRMHVDVAVRAKLGAFAAADAPVLDDDLEVLLSANGADRALRHAKRVAAGTARGRDKEMVVAQSVPKQARNSVVRLGAGLDTGIAPGAVVEVDQEKVLGFEQSLVQVIVEIDAGRSDSALGSCHPRFRDRFELRARPEISPASG